MEPYIPSSIEISVSSISLVRVTVTSSTMNTPMVSLILMLTIIEVTRPERVMDFFPNTPSILRETKLLVSLNWEKTLLNKFLISAQEKPNSSKKISTLIVLSVQVFLPMTGSKDKPPPLNVYQCVPPNPNSSKLKETIKCSLFKKKNQIQTAVPPKLKKKSNPQAPTPIQPHHHRTPITIESLNLKRESPTSKPLTIVLPRN